MIPASTLPALAPMIDREVEADVVVVGGGTAGFIAAMAAARNGARTVLVEYLPFLGGTHGGGGMVYGTIGFRRGTEPTGELVIRGLPLEYYNQLVDVGGTYGQRDEPGEGYRKDLELTKVITEQMVEEAGADIWFMTQLVDVVMEGPTVAGALVTRGGGLTLVRAPVIVDASGDGEAARRAGARFEMGRPQDGKTEAATLYFELGGVDVYGLLERLRSHPEEISTHHRQRGVTADTLLADLEAGRPMVVRIAVAYDDARQRGELPVPPGAMKPEPGLGTFWMHWRAGRLATSSFSVNMDTTYGLDPTDRDQLDEMLVASRRFVLAMVEHYRQYAPGFGEAYLLRFAPMLGIREGRRIVGDYVLTEADVLAASDFPDAIGRCGTRVDIHPEDPGGKDFILHEVGGERGWYQVPYRCLVPAGVEGVLVAGRCISADHIAHGSVRHQVVCMMTGQAAGTAAALAVCDRVSPRHIDVRRLQMALRKQDVLI